MCELGSCDEAPVGGWHFLCSTFIFQYFSDSLYTVIFFKKKNCFGAIFCCLWASGSSGLQDCVAAGGVTCVPTSLLPLFTVTCLVVLPPVCGSHELRTFLTPGGREPLTVKIWTSQILRVWFRNPGASQAEGCASPIMAMDVTFQSPCSLRDILLGWNFISKVSGPFVQGFLYQCSVNVYFSPLSTPLLRSS